MKKLLVLLTILLVITIPSCQTIREKELVTVKYILPAFPDREIISLPDNPTIKDYAEIINYYDKLVEKWEVWGEIVSDIIKHGSN